MWVDGNSQYNQNAHHIPAIIVSISFNTQGKVNGTVEGSNVEVPNYGASN